MLEHAQNIKRNKQILYYRCNDVIEVPKISLNGICCLLVNALSKIIWHHRIQQFSTTSWGGAELQVS